MDEVKEKFTGGHDTAREAFDELCAMVDALHAEREERREVANGRFTRMRATNMRLRERNRRLRGRYAAMVDAYNALAEEAHDRSDSSSSEEEEEDDTCCIM